MSLVDKHLYKFREFNFDVNEKTLVSENSRISLTPKVFELLLLTKTRRQIFVTNLSQMTNRKKSAILPIIKFLISTFHPMANSLLLFVVYEIKQL